MPLYEYICNNDGCQVKSFDFLNSYEEQEKAICPKCKERSEDRKKVYQFDFRM